VPAPRPLGSVPWVSRRLKQVVHRHAPRRAAIRPLIPESGSNRAVSWLSGARGENRGSRHPTEEQQKSDRGQSAGSSFRVSCSCGMGMHRQGVRTLLDLRLFRGDAAGWPSRMSTLFGVGSGLTSPARAILSRRSGNRRSRTCHAPVNHLRPYADQRVLSANQATLRASEKGPAKVTKMVTVRAHFFLSSRLDPV